MAGKVVTVKADTVGKTLKSRASEAPRTAKKMPAKEETKTAAKASAGPRKGEVDALSLFADLYRQI